MLDTMCGGLRASLRMCGHDTAYSLDRDCEAGGEVLELVESEDRTLVTRNVQLAERVDESILLRERDVVDELGELHRAGVDLTLDESPAFCGACNGSLERVGPAEPTAEDAPDPRTEAVWRCADCGQLFWKGSHWERVAETLEAVRDG
nr:Mut7-C RNAse domain-containing protein [Halomarina oriensis]